MRIPAPDHSNQKYTHIQKYSFFIVFKQDTLIGFQEGVGKRNMRGWGHKYQLELVGEGPKNYLVLLLNFWPFLGGEYDFKVLGRGRPRELRKLHYLEERFTSIKDAGRKASRH